MAEAGKTRGRTVRSLNLDITVRGADRVHEIVQRVQCWIGDVVDTKRRMYSVERMEIGAALTPRWSRIGYGVPSCRLEVL